MSNIGPHTSALLAAAITLGGCVTTRYVTPWLRTTVDHPVDIIAESGSGQQHHTTEELFHGQWIVLSSSGEAMSIRGGKRAIYLGGNGYVMVTESGHARPITCQGVLRESPDERTLDCLEYPSFHRSVAPFDVVWRRYDATSSLLGQHRMSLEDDLISEEFTPSFIGFSSTGAPVLLLAVGADGGDRPPRCALYEASSTGLTLLGAFEANDSRTCNDVGFWRDRRVKLDAGRTPQEQ